MYQAYRSPARRRFAALLLAVVIHALLILMLLTLAPTLTKPKEDRTPVTFSLAPGPQPAASREAKKATKKDSKEAAAPRARPTPPTPTPPPKAPPTPELPFIVLSSKDLASGDIGKMPARPTDGGGKQGPGAGQSAAAAYGPGEGPGGVQLFEAEWYRRPTHAELVTYTPSNAPPKGWGLVACKTVENYRVENCQALGESPLGSGFARAVRLAAWQFQVLPPRIDGRPVIGSWVRIRIDYTQVAAPQ